MNTCSFYCCLMSDADNRLNSIEDVSGFHVCVRDKCFRIVRLLRRFEHDVKSLPAACLTDTCTYLHPIQSSSVTVLHRTLNCGCRLREEVQEATHKEPISPLYIAMVALHSRMTLRHHRIFDALSNVVSCHSLQSLSLTRLEKQRDLYSSQFSVDRYSGIKWNFIPWSLRGIIALWVGGRGGKVQWFHEERSRNKISLRNEPNELSYSAKQPDDFQHCKNLATLNIGVNPSFGLCSKGKECGKITCSRRLVKDSPKLQGE